MPLTPQQAKEAFEAKKYQKLQEELKRCYKEIDEALSAGKRLVHFNEGLTKEAEAVLEKQYTSFMWELHFKREKSCGDQNYADVEKVSILFEEK